MQEILGITLASMQQDMERVNGIATNLANVATPGYKRSVAAMRPFVDAMNEVVLADGLMPAGAHAMAGTALGMQVRLDSRAGTIRHTGEPMDLAINGDGFFEVTTENGPAYTRQGNFRTDPRGRLVTAHGDPVMGSNGEIYLTTQSPVVDSAGNVTEPDATTGPSAGAAGQPVAQVKLVKFDDPSTMRAMGNGLMAAGTGMNVMKQSDMQLTQGAIENSNVNPITEMTQMMLGVRHFETMQKIAQGYDDMVGSAITKLGELS
jgi:flagellar basal-body rod protein FlgF